MREVNRYINSQLLYILGYNRLQRASCPGHDGLYIGATNFRQLRGYIRVLTAERLLNRDFDASLGGKIFPLFASAGGKRVIGVGETYFLYFLALHVLDDDADDEPICQWGLKDVAFFVGRARNVARGTVRYHGNF